MPAYSILLSGRDIAFSLRRSHLSKRIVFSVSSSGDLTVSAPLWVRTRDVLGALKEQERWILEKLDEAKAKKRPLDSASFLGKSYPVKKMIAPGRRPAAALKNEVMYVRVRDDSEESVRSALEKLYIREAKQLFPALVEKHNNGHVINRIAVKNQRTRWGSCSNGHNLNFNWRLLMAPLDTVEYIVVHELAHLEEMSHSRRFWNIVASRCPDYKRHNKWLKVNGPGLVI